MLQPEKDYGVRVITAFEQRRVGQIFFPPGTLREALLRRHLVERVTEDAPADVEGAQPELPAMGTARKKRS